jgi:DNA-binding transcriptional MerR regulator
MGRKRTLQQIIKLDKINIGELATLCIDVFSTDDKFRQSTLKFYCEVGILPFLQAGPGLNRKFDRVEAIKRLKLIDELKTEKHFSIEDIVSYFKKKGNSDDKTEKTDKPE